MKKTVFLLTVLTVSFSALHAQDQGPWAAGGRAGMMFGFHTEKEFLTDHNYDAVSKFNFAAALYGSWTFAPRFALQLEADLMLGQGLKGGEQDLNLRYTSLDIPVLVKYTFLDRRFSLGVLAGPYVSIPLGKWKFDRTGLSDQGHSDNVSFGAAAGLAGGFRLGPGRIVGDLRFIFDFNPVKAKAEDGAHTMLARRGLVFTAGYEYSF